MVLTKDQWNEYRDVQDSGLYNMYDPNARAMTSLCKDEWLYIMKNYKSLKEKYENE